MYFSCFLLFAGVRILARSRETLADSLILVYLYFVALRSQFFGCCDLLCFAGVQILACSGPHPLSAYSRGKRPRIFYYSIIVLFLFLFLLADILLSLIFLLHRRSTDSRMQPTPPPLLTYMGRRPRIFYVSISLLLFALTMLNYSIHVVEILTNRSRSSENQPRGFQNRLRGLQHRFPTSGPVTH